MTGRLRRDNAGRAMTESGYRLVIGDKAYSSWSLRPWLLMRVFGLPFEEVRVRLRQPESAMEIQRHSPSGKVPALIAGPLVVWDSLAIAEFLAERHPDLPIWPAAPDARAAARCLSAEMHSGFQALRNEMPMDFLADHPGAVSEAVETDIRRIVRAWGDARATYGDGTFLFGAFSAADAMFAPVVSRFRTYAVDLAGFGDDGTAGAYAEGLLALQEMADWARGAAEELAAHRPD